MEDAAAAIAGLQVDMVYARADNFTGEVLYPAARCLLRPAVVRRLAAAQATLQRRRPDLTLRVKDCYRPDSIQRRMFATVRGTGRQGYVVNPESAHGSVHSYGAAVDITLAHRNGPELDMGTPHDELSHLAEPRREAAHVAAGRLTPAQIARRRLLRSVMAASGFKSISTEWWHFDAWRGAALRARYGRLDRPLMD